MPLLRCARARRVPVRLDQIEIDCTLETSSATCSFTPASAACVSSNLRIACERSGTASGNPRQIGQSHRVVALAARRAPTLANARAIRHNESRRIGVVSMAGCTSGL